MPVSDNRDSFLPDCCSAEGLLPLLVIAELVAVVLALAGLGGADRFWSDLFFLSVYLQWIGVCSAGVLCAIRRHLHAAAAWRIAAVSYAGLLLVVLALAEVTHTAGRYTGIAPLVADIGHAEFLTRNLGIGAIVAALGLRYFWLRDLWRRQAAAELAARYRALQARIRPHFLFNVLNGIAELVVSRPQAAERALEDLSALLRAALVDDERRLVPLSEELALTRAYIDIETLRLGERLRVEWDVSPEAEGWPVPPLCLQPLVENAIIHGISRLPEGGRVYVNAAIESDGLALSVVNPLPAEPAGTGGQRLALDNIEQRLALRYGKSVRLHRRAAPGRFEVAMRLPRPHQEAP
jgi:two-component system sensor histidine kinase AlgZ